MAAAHGRAGVVWCGGAEALQAAHGRAGTGQGPPVFLTDA